MFPQNPHICPVCICLSADNQRIQDKSVNFSSNGKLFVFIGRDREKGSYFVSERRFEKTDAMVRNTGIYRLSDHFHL